jgi:hypothetical protein
LSQRLIQLVVVKSTNEEAKDEDITAFIRRDFDLEFLVNTMSANGDLTVAHPERVATMSATLKLNRRFASGRCIRYASRGAAFDFSEARELADVTGPGLKDTNQTFPRASFFQCGDRLSQRYVVFGFDRRRRRRIPNFHKWLEQWLNPNFAAKQECRCIPGSCRLSCAQIDHVHFGVHFDLHRPADYPFVLVDDPFTGTIRLLANTEVE